MAEGEEQWKGADLLEQRHVPSDQAYQQRQQLSSPQMYSGQPSQGYTAPPPPYPGPPAQSTVQYQSGPQIVYIQIAPPLTRVYQDYNGKLSIGFGVLNILLVSTSIILNVFAFDRQLDREYDWIGNMMIIVCPSAFCGFFIYLDAAFSIASGVHKTRYLIISHLVLAIIGSIFAFSFLGISLGSISYEILSSVPDTLSLATSIVWSLFSLTMFVTIIWGSTLCCKVICSDTPLVAVSGNVLHPVAAGDGT